MPHFSSLFTPPKHSLTVREDFESRFVGFLRVCLNVSSRYKLLFVYRIRRTRVNSQLSAAQVKLILYQFVVVAAARGKLIVRSLFDDASVGEHHDVVGTADGTQAVGDDNDGLAPEQLLQAFHDSAFVIGVQGIGRLVEQEVLGILVSGAGYEDALFLFRACLPLSSCCIPAAGNL